MRYDPDALGWHRPEALSYVGSPSPAANSSPQRRFSRFRKTRKPRRQQPILHFALAEAREGGAPSAGALHESRRSPRRRLFCPGITSVARAPARHRLRHRRRRHRRPARAAAGSAAGAAAPAPADEGRMDVASHAFLPSAVRATHAKLRQKTQRGQWRAMTKLWRTQTRRKRPATARSILAAPRGSGTTPHLGRLATQPESYLLFLPAGGLSPLREIPARPHPGRALKFSRTSSGPV